MARLIALLLLAATGCSGQRNGTPVSRGPLELGGRDISGQLSYEARHATPLGASIDLETRPVRFVEVSAVDPSGGVVATTRTDAEGRFEVSVPLGAARLVAFARITEGSHLVSTARDARGQEVFSWDLPEPVGDGRIVAIAREHGPEGLAGAFHILDVLYAGLDAAERWTGHDLPEVVAYWGRGVTRDWSYYRGEQPPGSGRYLIELMGGEPGRQGTSDTDEHDEAIIVHELGHFVMDQLSTSSSLGGRHPPGTLVDPGLAWE